MNDLNPTQQKVLDDIREEAADYRMMLDTNPLFEPYTEAERQREAAEIVLQSATRNAVRHIRKARPEQARMLLHAAERIADTLHESPAPATPE